MTKAATTDVHMQPELLAAYEAFFQHFLPQWKQELALQTALVSGSGAGALSEFLRRMGFEVTSETQPSAASAYDLVLSLGFVHEMQDPFGAIRHLRSATKKLLIMESYCLPEETPLILLCDEHVRGENGERTAGCYTSEGALIKMAFLAGYSHVYRFRELPNHEQFQRVVRFDRVHTMLAAANCEVESPILEEAAEPVISLSEGLWSTEMRSVSELLGRLGRKVRHRKPDSKKQPGE